MSGLRRLVQVERTSASFQNTQINPPETRLGMATNRVSLYTLNRLRKKAEMFVGRGFSRDIMVFVSSGVLTPEGFRTFFLQSVKAAPEY
jgi:hypothetical protein